MPEFQFSRFPGKKFVVHISFAGHQPGGTKKADIIKLECQKRIEKNGST
jgi:hypothetical protein